MILIYTCLSNNQQSRTRTQSDSGDIKIQTIWHTPISKVHLMKLLTRLEWTLLIIISIYSFIPTFGGLFRILELATGTVIAPSNPRALANPFPIVAHILASFVFCIVGALQFLPSIRRHRPATHRANGLVVLIAGCISAATGLWLTHFYAFPTELQGSLLYSVRMFLGFSMIGLIGWAVIAIRSRNIFGHSSALLRAYAIGQGASTQTFLGIGWIVISGTEAMGPIRDVMMVSAWTFNLLIAEILVRKMLAPRYSFA